MRNANENRYQPKEFSVSSANTWEQKTLTFTGDTSGTWGTTNGIGINFGIVLAAGSSQQGTADTWQTGPAYTTSNQVNWQGTSGATFYLTGVQLEVGSKATPFEHESYGQTLAKCQRYVFVARQDSAQTGFMNGAMWTSAVFIGVVHYPVTMRAKPDVTIADLGDLTIFSNGSTDTIDAFVVQNQGLTATEISISLDAGLTGGNSAWARLASGGSSSKIVFNAEL
jgi:hypothetical protein